MSDDLISEQRLKYESIAARISVGKASQDEATKAIIQLCKDNERLAVIAGKLRADLDAANERAEKANRRAETLAQGWKIADDGRIEAEADAAALRAALTPFAFYDEDGGDVQHAWEIRYRDRFQDWIDYGDIERARAALAPAMPEGE